MKYDKEDNINLYLKDMVGVKKAKIKRAENYPAVINELKYLKNFLTTKYRCTRVARVLDERINFYQRECEEAKNFKKELKDD